MLATRANLILLLIAFPTTLLALPAPQAEEPTSASTQASVSDVDEVVTTTEQASAQDNDGNIFDLLADIFEGSLDLAHESVNVFSDLIKNVSLPGKEVADFGLNATRSAIKLGKEAIRDPEKVMMEKKKFIEGLQKTLKDTQPIVEASVKEFGRHAEIGAAFIKAYSDTMLGSLDSFLKIFDSRLKCNIDCKDKKEGSEERKSCEEEFCKDTKTEKNNKDKV